MKCLFGLDSINFDDAKKITPPCLNVNDDKGHAKMNHAIKIEGNSSYR